MQLPAGLFADDSVVRTANPGGSHPVVLVCEHASFRIPPEFHDLGLKADALTSHIAWDPGAMETALALSGMLDASLVYSTVSRLVYDCNRPPEAPAAMPAVSEIYAIPGNSALTQAERQARAETYYRPFEHCLEEVLEERNGDAVVVTLHSFTPVYTGVRRDVEIGVLHDADSRFADAMLDAAEGYNVRRNEPYGPADGVTHTLKRHALPRGLLNVMIEIRNDLIATPEQCLAMATHLSKWLEASLASLRQPQLGETAK